MGRNKTSICKKSVDHRRKRKYMYNFSVVATSIKDRRNKNFKTLRAAKVYADTLILCNYRFVKIEEIKTHKVIMKYF